MHQENTKLPAEPPTRKPTCWTCIYCGYHHFNQEIEFAKVACMCGRGKGRWKVDYIEPPGPEQIIEKWSGVMEGLADGSRPSVPSPSEPVWDDEDKELLDEATADDLPPISRSIQRRVALQKGEPMPTFTQYCVCKHSFGDHVVLEGQCRVFAIVCRLRSCRASLPST